MTGSELKCSGFISFHFPGVPPVRRQPAGEANPQGDKMCCDLWTLVPAFMYDYLPSTYVPSSTIIIAVATIRELARPKGMTRKANFPLASASNRNG